MNNYKFDVMEEKMKKHVTVVAAIQVGFSLLGLIGALAVFFGLTIAKGAVGDSDQVALSVLRLLTGILPVVIGLTAALGLAGGIGLFSHRQWARYVVIVLAALGLLAVPIGTLKGVYFLWVLLQSDTVKLFEKEEALRRGNPVATNI